MQSSLSQLSPVTSDFESGLLKDRDLTNTEPPGLGIWTWKVIISPGLNPAFVPPRFCVKVFEQGCVHSDTTFLCRSSSSTYFLCELRRLRGEFPGNSRRSAVSGSGHRRLRVFPPWQHTLRPPSLLLPLFFTLPQRLSWLSAPTRGRDISGFRAFQSKCNQVMSHKQLIPAISVFQGSNKAPRVQDKTLMIQTDSKAVEISGNSYSPSPVLDQEVSPWKMLEEKLQIPAGVEAKVVP